MNKTVIAFMFSCMIFSAGSQAFACYCSDDCSAQLRDAGAAEKRITKINQKIDALMRRLHQALEDKAESQGEWARKCDALNCKITQIRSDGQAILDTFLANPINSECNMSCANYLRLQNQIDKKICRAETAYSKCLVSKDKDEDRQELKIQRLMDRLSPLRADLYDAQQALAEAQGAYAVCRTGYQCACIDYRDPPYHHGW